MYTQQLASVDGNVLFEGYNAGPMWPLSIHEGDHLS